jgi:NADP-dependent 3-hydroxy acid dehydrogenase YdfG
MQAVLPIMRAQGSGTIVNIGSGITLGGNTEVRRVRRDHVKNRG